MVRGFHLWDHFFDYQNHERAGRLSGMACHYFENLQIVRDIQRVIENPHRCAEDRSHYREMAGERARSPDSTHPHKKTCSSSAYPTSSKTTSTIPHSPPLQEITLHASS